MGVVRVAAIMEKGRVLDAPGEVDDQPIDRAAMYSLAVGAFQDVSMNGRRLTVTDEELANAGGLDGIFALEQPKGVKDPNKGKVQFEVRCLDFREPERSIVGVLTPHQLLVRISEKFKDRLDSVTSTHPAGDWRLLGALIQQQDLQKTEVARFTGPTMGGMSELAAFTHAGGEWPKGGEVPNPQARQASTVLRTNALQMRVTLVFVDLRQAELSDPNRRHGDLYNTNEPTQIGKYVQTRLLGDMPHAFRLERERAEKVMRNLEAQSQAAMAQASKSKIERFTRAEVIDLMKSMPPAKVMALLEADLATIKAYAGVSGE